MARNARGRLLTLLGAWMAMVIAPRDAVSQTVVGRVLERGGGGPVAGAMVRLQVDGADAGRRWLTGPDGSFRLVAPSAGEYGLTVERIGFATATRGPLRLVDGGYVSMDVVVEARAIELEGLAVSAEGGRCEAEPTGGTAQLLWDEARKALAAATWTEERGQLRFAASVWDRQIDPRTSQILLEQTERRETVGTNSVRSLPPEELAAEGYVRADPSYTYYYAPDARVLLSDSFRDSHCFRVVPPEDDASPYVGLGFEPDSDRDRPDVAGVLWIDAESGRLDRLSFRYTGLDVPRADRAEGEVRWSELSNGLWIVREWYIRAPMGRGTLGTPGRLRRGGGGALHEVGNRVEVVSGPDFEWRPDFVAGALEGQVFDSISRAPLAAATVRVAGRAPRARSDLSGRYRLEGVPPGVHRVTFDHPTLDSLGVTPGWETVRVGAGEVAVLDLVVPSWTTLLARTCGARGAGAVVGIVRDRSGSVVAGATVGLARGAAASARPSQGPQATPVDATDRLGGYVLCDVPPGVVRVEARRGGARSPAIEERAQADRFVQVDLVLGPAPLVGPPVPGALNPALIGTVLALGSRAPIADVAVDLLDEEGAVLRSTLTDEDGFFRAVLDGGARVHLRVSRMGFTGAVSDAIDVTNGTRRIEVTLPEEAIELEPVVVVVEGRDPVLETEGFYRRATSTPGLFIRRDDVQAVAPARTTDLLGRAPGVRVATDALGGDLRRRVTFQRLTLAGGARCWPTVFIDGEMVRAGGSRSETEPLTIEGIDPRLESEDVPSLDELVPPHEILAVEMYQIPGQVPRRFVGLGAHCGVIVVWTTRGAPPPEERRAPEGSRLSAPRVPR